MRNKEPLRGPRRKFPRGLTTHQRGHLSVLAQTDILCGCHPKDTLPSFFTLAEAPLDIGFGKQAMLQRI